MYTYTKNKKLRRKNMANYFKPKDFLEIIYGSEYSKLDDSYIEKEGGKKIKQKEVNTMLYIMSLLFPDKVIEVLTDRKTTYIDQFIEHCNYLNDTSGVSQTFKYNNRPNLFQNAEMFAQLSDDDILKCLKNINNEKLINNRVSTELDNNWEIILDKFDLYIDKKNKLCKKIGNYERILLLFVSSLTQITYEKKHPKVDLGFERLLKYFAEHDNFENTANVDEYGFIPMANESKTKKDEFIAISFKTDSTNEKDATGNDIVTVLKEKLTERLNIVVGNGGIGKSTLLSKSLKHVLAEKYQIPIMYKSVELKNFSQAVGFYQFITGKGVISEEEKKNLDSFFSAGNKHFVIGLDAIDEMTDRKDAFYNGLKKALREWKNVSFILTTRYTSDLDQLKAYITEVKGNTYTLTGITAANIINYLDKDTNNSKKSRKKFGEEIYYGVSEYMREQLMPVPLFLEKIKQLIDGADSDPLEMLKKVNSTSRLFDMFYEREANEKRGVLESRYVYDFVIPYICFSIKKKTNSEISESELQKQIDYVLREYYADNQSVFKGEVIPATIDAESGIIEAMQSGLTILQVDESKTDDYYFTFSHAIIGSYFSAKFIVNTINIASNKKVTPLINFIKSSGIGDVRWSSEVLDYVNQLLFENAEDGKKAIQNILNAYNGKEMPECLLQNILNLLSFNRNKVYAVSGATASSAETRKKMSKNATPTDVNNGIIKEYTFKGLDFKGCRINGMKFRGCTFEDCHNIDEDVLSPDGHRASITDIILLNKSNSIISIDENQCVVTSDVYSAEERHSYNDFHVPLSFCLKKASNSLYMYKETDVMYNVESDGTGNSGKDDYFCKLEQFHECEQLLSCYADTYHFKADRYADDRSILPVTIQYKKITSQKNCSEIWMDYVFVGKIIKEAGITNVDMSFGFEYAVNPFDINVIVLYVYSISPKNNYCQYLICYNTKENKLMLKKECCGKQIKQITFTDNGSQILCANNKEIYLYKVSGHMHSDKKYSFYCTDKEKSQRELSINHSSVFYLPDGRKAALISDKNNLYISMLTNEKRSEVQKEAYLIYTAKYEISCIAVEHNKNSDNSYFIALGDICGDVYSLLYTYNDANYKSTNCDTCTEIYIKLGLEPWERGGVAFYDSEDYGEGFISVSIENDNELDFFKLEDNAVAKSKSCLLQLENESNAKITISNIMHTPEKLLILTTKGLINKKMSEILQCKDNIITIKDNELIRECASKGMYFKNLIYQYHSDDLVFIRDRYTKSIMMIDFRDENTVRTIIQDSSITTSSISASGDYLVQVSHTSRSDYIAVNISKTDSLYEKKCDTESNSTQYTIEFDHFATPVYVFFDDTDTKCKRLILYLSAKGDLINAGEIVVYRIDNDGISPKPEYSAFAGEHTLSVIADFKNGRVVSSDSYQTVYIFDYKNKVKSKLFIDHDNVEDAMFVRTFCYFNITNSKMLVSLLGRSMKVFDINEISFKDHGKNKNGSSVRTASLKNQKYIEINNIPHLEFKECAFFNCTFGEKSPDTVKQILSLNGATL